MLWPHYGIGMYQAVALLLVPDIPLTKTVKQSLQLTLHVAKYFMIYNWNFTLYQKCDVLNKLSGFKA